MVSKAQQYIWKTNLCVSIFAHVTYKQLMTEEKNIKVLHKQLDSHNHSITVVMPCFAWHSSHTA